MTEYLDHIDEDDNVIGRVTREEAHRDFLLHRSVAILIETREGKIVLQHRRRDKATGRLRMQASASGHVQAGQSYEIAAIAELKEELGIETELRLLGQFRKHIPNIENEIGMAFFGSHDGPFIAWEEEAESLMYFTREELDKLIAEDRDMFTPSFQEAYRLLREREKAETSS